MNLQHLRHFVAVAKELNFGRAAERVGISQPPLSQSIRRLETSLGCELFKRSRRHVELTIAGEALYQHAQEIIDQVDYARVAVSRAATIGVNRVVIGFTPNALSESVPGAISAIRDLAPHANISLHEGKPEELVHGLLVGEIDFAFFPPDKEVKGLEIRLVERSPVVAAIPADWDLARKEKVTLRDLATVDILLFPKHHRPAAYELILAAFRNVGAFPNIAQEASFDDTRMKLVAAGLGVSLVSQSVAPRGYGGVALRRIEDLPRGIYAPLACAWRRSSPPTLSRLFVAAYEKIARV